MTGREDVATFTRTPSGRIVVDHWPATITVAIEFFDPMVDGLAIVDGQIRIRVDNGWAHYVITGVDGFEGKLFGRIRAGEWSPAEYGEAT